VGTEKQFDLTRGVIWKKLAGFFLCGSLGRLFVADGEVIALSVSLMRFLAPLYILYTAGEILSGAIRGTGQTFKPMMLTLLGTCACRILWILLAVPRHPTLKMVIGSYPVSWFLTSLLFVIFYFWNSKAKFNHGPH
jgi:Na+-driven multidrug efflux pump